ncbi:hypothetical protein EC844_12920 [Acinetobacter calcoaceticus]|uniref:RHS repeat-associated core domain protein n=1 Tax=Acinetobacter calcoaceticus TaxID=471 RepID=A0A4R1XBS7_ACICA|nr:hypothetical protein EC844_12920 [Acinetobacter calcoaceticus]
MLGGFNVYAYAPNPVEWVDPFGLSPKKPKKPQTANSSGGCIDTIRGIVESTMKNYEKDIQRLDTNAQIGYRGSFASGNKYTTGAPFNPNNFDVDGFINSDYLSAKSVYTNRRRDGSKITEIATIERKIDTDLRSKPCLKGMRSEGFGFRLFKMHELDDLRRKGDIQRRL